LAYGDTKISKAINGVTKPIYEYLPHFHRGKILPGPNQVPVIPMRILAVP
jgi:hypothetical protein